MYIMKKRFRLFFLAGFVLLSIIACKKDENDNPFVSINQEIYDMMKVVYLWNTNLPSSVNVSMYDSPADLMDDLRYDVYDKWSLVLTEDEFNQYFEEGKMIGHGFMLGLDNDDNIRIAFVYPSTEAYALGVRRSWIITKVNGISANASNVFSLLGDAEVGISNTITFIDENGSTVNKTLVKEEVNISPVLHYEVINKGSDRIGYMVFQDFIENANEQIDEVFDSFSLAGINEIIIDLRYNGGGTVDVAEHLASWLLGKDFANQPFVKYQHNSIMAQYWDTTINLLGNPAGLSPDRIFFIGTENTASASELMINGVKPYVESILAGSRTHGKPVGMYVLHTEKMLNYVILPVCFKYTNADNIGDFYNGLPVTLPAEDDLTRDFGNPEEASLKVILDYIETGAVPVKSAKSTDYRTSLIESDNSVRQFLKAY